MDENKRESIPEKKLEQVTGGGAFDDLPTVDEHPYDEDTRVVSQTDRPGINGIV